MGQRLQSAAVRATDAHMQQRRAAERVAREMDDITSPGAIPSVELHEEDSMVIVVEAARTELNKPSG